MATPPTTLAELATETVKLYADAAKAAQRDLGAAQAALAAVRARLAADTANLAATQRELAALRAQLAVTEVPADLDALLVDISELQVVEREDGARLLDDADAVAAAQAQADAATAWLALLERGAGQAAAAVAPSRADKERRDRWKAAATAAPLATLPAAAAALQDGATFTNAEGRVIAELPQPMRDVVDQGWAVEKERLAEATESVDAAWTLVEAEATGTSPLVLAHDLAVAEERLRRWSEQAAQRFARAQAQVSAVLAGTSLLTEAERAAVDANVGAGPAAADKLEAREAARAAVIDAQATYDDAVLAARAADPTDLDVANMVATEQATLTGKKDLFGDAINEYTTGRREAWGLWSGDVPAAVWKKIAGLKEADDTLTELRALTGAGLVTAVSSAESALAGALWSAEVRALKLGFLETQAGLRGALVEHILAARPARLLAAVRGDA